MTEEVGAQQQGNERLAALEAKLSTLLEQIPSLFEHQSEIAASLQRIDGHLTAATRAIEQRQDATDRLQQDHEDRIRALEKSQGKNGSVISILERSFWLLLAGAVGVATRMLGS